MNRARFILALLLLVLAASLAGCGAITCSNEPSIAAADIAEPLELVAARHDAYVLSDETLTPEERDVYLRTSEMLRVLVDQAQATSNEPPAPADVGGG